MWVLLILLNEDKDGKGKSSNNIFYNCIGVCLSNNPYIPYNICWINYFLKDFFFNSSSTGQYKPYVTVNKQESFLTYFCETNENLFHGRTIGVIGQAPLWKKIGHVILIQSVTSGIDISFSSNLWNKTWWSFFLKVYPLGGNCYSNM